MSDLRELYQEVILDHSKRPRNAGRLADANRAAHGDNPLCGDKLALALRVRGGVVEDVAYEAAGCAISVASASLMSETVKGRPVAEVEEVFDRFHRLLTAEPKPDDVGDLGKLEVFAGVREFPIRVKCATLPWHTLHAAIERGAEGEATVSTE